MKIQLFAFLQNRLCTHSRFQLKDLDVCAFSGSVTFPPFPSVRGTACKILCCYHTHTARRPQDKSLLPAYKEGDVAHKMIEHGVKITEYLCSIFGFSGFGGLFLYLNDTEA